MHPRHPSLHVLAPIGRAWLNYYSQLSIFYIWISCQCCASPAKRCRTSFLSRTRTTPPPPTHTHTHTHTPVWCNLEIMIADSSNLFCCLFCLESVSTQLSEVTLNQYPTKKWRVPLLRSFHMDRFETSGRSPSGSLRMHYLQAFEG